MWKISQKGVGAQPRWRPTLVSQNLSCCASRSVVAPCRRAGRYGAKSIKGEAVHDQRSTRAEAPSRIQPTHEVLPRADPRSFVSAPENLCRDHTQEPWVLRSARGDSSALLPIPIVACCSPPMELR